MSLNQIVNTLNPLAQLPAEYRHLSCALRELVVDGNIYVKEDEFNRENFTLQCYAEGRARFLPRPILNELTHDNFFVVADEENTDPDAYFSFHPQDVDTNFQQGGDAYEIVCLNTGLYWTTYRISKANGTFGLRTQLEVNDALVNITFAGSPYTPGSRAYSSNISGFLYRFTAGDVIKLYRNYYPVSDIGVVLTPEFDDKSASSITFVKINV